jgi:Holliday junction resolvase
MTAYQRGNAFERRIADRLRADGYYVWQTRGSKSPVDILAIKPGQILFVQCKIGVAALSAQRWDELHDLATRAGALPILADRPTLRRYRFRRITGRYRPHVPGETRGGDWPTAPFPLDAVIA